MGCIGVTGALHLADSVPAAIRHIDKKDVFTTAGITIGLAIPPVTDGEGGCVRWDGETLSYAVVTATITAEKGAVMPRMWIG